MGDITLTFAGGRTGLTEEVLGQRLQAAAPLLAEVLAGEEQYQDNLGWFAVDEAAGPERVDFLLEQAARVRADADAFVVIGIGGSNQAARAVVKALRPENGPAILWAGNTISACETARLLKELDGYQGAAPLPGAAVRPGGGGKAHLRHRHPRLHPPPAVH